MPYRLTVGPRSRRIAGIAERDEAFRVGLLAAPNASAPDALRGRAARTAKIMRMPACVYLLRCADGSLYTGWTVDLDRRLAAHAAGRGARYTRSRLPVELVACLPMADAGAARREEARIKRLSRPAKLALVAAAP
jgi:putative endonuclease